MGTPVVESVKIRSYPKAVFLYPLFLVSIFCAVWSHATAGGGLDAAASALPGRIFFVVFAINLLAFAWDFSRTGFLGVLAIAVITILLVLLVEQKVDVVGDVERFFGRVQLKAHWHFYLAFSGVLGFILLLAVLRARIDYWEVNAGELLHWTGIVGNVERFPAPTLRFRKELPDIFEYAILRSGTIVLEPAQGERHVLTHVLHVNSIERRMERLLSSIDVTVEAPKPPPPPDPSS
ncbi:hypothetical protein HY251_17515 [bacterium]|nr:hypothetical protein [bacterium]